jgi:hypothetical protein
MVIALPVSLIVVVALVVMGVAGYLLDRTAGD